MNLGTLLVLIGIILAVLSLLIENRRFLLLAIAVISIGLGVLVGVDAIDVSDDALAALVQVR